MDKPHWGLRVDGPLGRRFLRGLSLTRLWREGCCRAPLNYRRRPLMIKPNNRAFARGKTSKPGFARGKTDRPRTAGAVVWFSTAECLSCHMALKVNPVTLTSYSSPPKGETTHYILRVASAPSSTAVTDSLDFQVADAPLQIQFA